jgi:hypothetical protein
MSRMQDGSRAAIRPCRKMAPWPQEAAREDKQ